MTVRILEIECCGDCPHLDARWTDPPWHCDEEFVDVMDKDSFAEYCPLPTKEEYYEGE
jgi:hypothetical protein